MSANQPNSIWNFRLLQPNIVIFGVSSGLAKAGNIFRSQSGGYHDCMMTLGSVPTYLSENETDEVTYEFGVCPAAHCADLLFSLQWYTLRRSPSVEWYTFTACNECYSCT